MERRRLKTAVVIQARMASERLPGKVLKRLGKGPEMLEWVVERCSRARSSDGVIVATTTNPADDRIVEFCEKHAYPCFRGPEHDVLNRYLRCAAAYDLGVIVRITSDCPFIAPEIIEACLGRFYETGCDYVNNSRLEKTFPRGLDVEVVSRRVLEEIEKVARNEDEREHVTLYIYEHPEAFRIETVKANADYVAPGLRLTVDTEEDLKLASDIAETFQSEGIYLDTRKVIRFLKDHPERGEINKEVQQKPIRGRII